ncbi:hypothetical protein EXIGLDRAFT_759681 [Exidia glandulosa HHB12029]|uniref:Uncharacterized protein n=1 Tax=Exidia glandulosa HHB12029 TaxID=1314781 RepID=A0A165PR49_EXIGL|nr:hypothetical protein EXIGLDRAFT_759681 [Exidia glandulosa HHB12029]
MVSVKQSTTPSTSHGAPEDKYIALKSYSQSLHEYTQRQWLDARRQAELAAQQGATASSSRSHSANGFMRKSKSRKA